MFKNILWVHHQNKWMKSSSREWHKQQLTSTSDLRFLRKALDNICEWIKCYFLYFVGKQILMSQSPYFLPWNTLYNIIPVWYYMRNCCHVLFYLFFVGLQKSTHCWSSFRIGFKLNDSLAEWTMLVGACSGAVWSVSQWWDENTHYQQHRISITNTRRPRRVQSTALY